MQCEKHIQIEKILYIAFLVANYAGLNEPKSSVYTTPYFRELIGPLFTEKIFFVLK